jgi:hypothetical protein
MAISPNVNFTSGQILTATNANQWPRGIMAFASRTTNTGALSVNTVTISAVSFTAVANRYYKITYYEPQSLPGGASTFAQMDIVNGTTTAGTPLQSCSVPQISGARAGATCTYVGTFTAGTINICATGSPNGGTVNFISQSNNFAFLMVEDLGLA